MTIILLSVLSTLFVILIFLGFILQLEDKETQCGISQNVDRFGERCYTPIGRNLIRIFQWYIKISLQIGFFIGKFVQLIQTTLIK